MSAKLRRIASCDVYHAFIAKQVRAEPLTLALGNDDLKKEMAPLSNATIQRQGSVGMLLSTVATNMFNSGGDSSVFEAEGELHDDNDRSSGDSTSNPLLYQEFWVDSACYVCVLKDLVSTKKTIAEGRWAHAHVIQSGLSSDISLGTQLVIMYGRCGGVDYARKVFDEMVERNVVSWTAMIAAYAKHGRSDEGLRLFYRMQQMPEEH